VLLEKDRVTR
jgi:hypothetical protein